MIKVFSLSLALVLLSISNPAFPSSQKKKIERGNQLLHGEWYSCKVKCGFCGCSTDLTHPNTSFHFSSSGRLSREITNEMFEGFFIPTFYEDGRYEVTDADTSTFLKRAKKVHFTFLRENEDQAEPYTLTVKKFTSDGFIVAEVSGIDSSHRDYCKYLGASVYFP